jgi:hypothetical protein
MNGQETTNTNNKPAPAKPSWFGEKVGKPMLWIGVGFIACKLFDAYTENKRAKRLAP